MVSLPERKSEGKTIEQLQNEVHVLKQEGGKSRDYLRYQLSLVRNSQAWVYSLFEPWEGAARYPENCTEGTDVSHLHSQGFTLATVQMSDGSGTNYNRFFSLAIFNASLTNNNWQLSGATGTLSGSNPNYTYNAFNHPRKDSMAAVVAAYRTTSFGINVKNISKLVDRNGKIYVGRLPPRKADQSPEVNLYSWILNSDTFVTFDLAELPPDGLTITWLPFTNQGYSASSTHDGTPSGGYPGLAFKAVNSVDTIDNRICILAEFKDETNTGAACELVVDFVYNVEHIPHVEDEYLFDPRITPGDESSISVAFHQATELLSKHGSAWSMLTTGVRSGLNEINWGKQFSKLATAVSSVAGGFLSSSLRANVPPRHERVKPGNEDDEKRASNFAADPVIVSEPPSPAISYSSVRNRRLG